MSEKPNISYLISDGDFEIHDENESQLDIQKLLSEFDNMDIPYQPDEIIAQISDYELNYTLKQLTLICEYYEIKVNKMKKMQIIETLVSFENNLENIEIVMRRQQMWHYITTLKEDKFMKKYIFFF
jgi:hypothetical protein